MKLELRRRSVVCRLGEIGYKRCNKWEFAGSWGAGRHRNDKGALRMNVWNASAGGLFAALIMFAVPVAATLAAALVSSPAAAQTVASIAVEGNRRVEVETIRSYFKPGPGGRLDQAQIDDGLKALIETGLFQDVQDQPARRPDRRRRGRKPGDRPHRLRGQQEGQGRAAFGGNPVQAARHAARARWCSRTPSASPKSIAAPAAMTSASRRRSSSSRTTASISSSRSPKAARPAVKSIEFVGNSAYSSYRLQGHHQDARIQPAELPRRQRRLRSGPRRGRPRPDSPLLSEARLRRRAGGGRADRI